jgi:hypothetical protein
VWNSEETYGYYEQVAYDGNVYTWLNKFKDATKQDVPGASSYWELTIERDNPVAPDWTTYIFINSPE